MVHQRRMDISKYFSLSILERFHITSPCTGAWATPPSRSVAVMLAHAIHHGGMKRRRAPSFNPYPLAMAEQIGFFAWLAGNQVLRNGSLYMGSS